MFNTEKSGFLSLPLGGEDVTKWQMRGKDFYTKFKNRIKFNFLQNDKVGFAETFLSKKFPAPSKISLRPHIPCASGNKPYKVFGNGYRTYGYQVGM